MKACIDCGGLPMKRSRRCYNCRNMLYGVTCIDCGTVITWRAKRCRSCSNKVLPATRGYVNWDGALYEQACELHHAGFSLAAVAKELGITKNAVVGKLSRTGMTIRRKEYGDMFGYKPTTKLRLRALHEKMNPLVPPERRVNLQSPLWQ